MLFFSLLHSAAMAVAFAYVASCSCAQHISLPGGGTLTGSVAISATGEKVQVFRGIPYAEPPVGDRRWTQATLKSLAGNVTATAFGRICYGDGRVDAQSNAFPASEDCLFLNVFTPINATAASKLPVLVWLHGGAFVAGAGNIYDGSNLVAAAAPNGQVVVTLNYRLSVFGLLSGDPLKRQGHGVNFGLRDQEVAFQWVQQHIALFGGNPRDVTAFGESAGAKSVYAHLAARAGHQCLFQKAIMQSGTYTTAHDMPTADEQNAAVSQLALQLGCDPLVEDATLLSCLRAANSSSVWAAGGLLGWQPVVDGVFLLDAPIRTLLAGRLSRVPTIIGTNTDEGWSFTSTVQTADAVMPFVRSRFSRLSESDLAWLEALYPPSSFPSLGHRISEIYGDAMYVCPSELVSSVLAASGQPTYRYRFNETAMVSGFPLVVHTAEIRYVFNLFPGVTLPSATRNLITAMQHYWTTFAATGSPNTLQAENVYYWPQHYARDRQQIVLQASNLTLETTGTSMPIHDERCAFWQGVELRLAPTLAVATSQSSGGGLRDWWAREAQCPKAW